MRRIHTAVSARSGLSPPALEILATCPGASPSGGKAEGSPRKRPRGGEMRSY